MNLSFAGYNEKYNLKQEVYIITNSTIYKTIVEKIRVTKQEPYSLISSDIVEVENAKNGICIEYFVMCNMDSNANLRRCEYDWFYEANVFSTKTEAIVTMK